MAEKLEETLKKIEATKEKLKKVMTQIDDYNMSNTNNIMDDKMYKANLEARTNLTINLDYFQNELIINQNSKIIEQNGEILKYLSGIKK